MKKIYTLISVLACAATLVSCSKFLKEDNPSGVTADTFYVTESGAEAGVKSCYTFMRLYYGKEVGYHMSELGTDIITAGDGCTGPEFSNYGMSLSSASSGNADIWKAWYLALNTCNEVLDKLPESPLPEATKKIRLGEVHFLRAFYLWHIVNTWGGVVLNTTPTTSPVTELHRSSVEEFYAVIKKDLEYAVANCPVTTNEYGRVTRGAAQALSARVYLYTKEYATALEFAKAVISSGQYSLAENFSELVDIKTCNGLKENIFVCNYASQANNNFNNSVTQGPDGKDMTIRNGGNNAHMFFTMTYDQVTDRNGEKPVNRCIEYGRPFNRFMPTLYYLDLFDETIDSRYDATIRQEWICNRKTSLVDVGDVAIIFSKYDVPDEVKDASPAIILDRSYVYNADGTVRNGKFNYAFTKFEDPTRGAVNDQHSGRDCVIIRLAEMYFIAAEASMYQNDNSAAAEYLNVIRRRAAIPGHEKDMEITAADVNIDFILDERGRELAGEMTRWFDLVRTGKLVERLKAHNPNATGIADYHTLRPIPQTTLDAVTNPDEFKQNPGY